MPSSSSLTAGLSGRCPRCGKGSLFSGMMTIVECCKICGLSFSKQDSGDGPVFFALVIVGFLMVGLAGFVEVRYAPPMWLHAALWIPFTFVATVLSMRFFKGWLIALQYKHSPESFTQ